MSEPAACPQCGNEIPAGSPAGLCPKCLVLAGLESQSSADPKLQPTQPSPAPSESTGFVPPTVEELAARFPQLEILELLGRGGMGAVYKARQRELDRLVAVKILPPEVSADPAFAERFTREARALARLSHPNIVAVHDFGRTPALPSPCGGRAGGEGVQAEGELFYFVMEYVDGVNLRQAILSGGMSPKEALAIVPQICDAQQFSHAEGIVHRDIKPENILIDKRGRVKIADFGLAKLLGQSPSDVSLTATKQVLGTLRYMAPEQMEGTKTVDHRADIYSLGVVFYELLTGELPIGRFAPPSRKVEIDVRLDDVVLRTLEKEPERRYQSASAVKSDVEKISGVQDTASTDNQSVSLGEHRFTMLVWSAMLVAWAGLFLWEVLMNHAARSAMTRPTIMLFTLEFSLPVTVTALAAAFFSLFRNPQGESWFGRLVRRMPLLIACHLFLFVIIAFIQQTQSTVRTNPNVTKENYVKIKPEMSSWELNDVLGAGEIISEQGFIVDEQGNFRRYSNDGLRSSGTSGTLNRHDGKAKREIRQTVVWRDRDRAIYVTLLNDKVLSKQEEGLYSREP